MLSTAKAEAVARDLKDRLEKRGFSVVESIEAKGRKLTIDTDAMSIRIEAKDGVSKDIFGNDNDAFTPHEVKLAIKDGTAFEDVVKAMFDIGKHGFAIKVGTGAALVANAEVAADTADEIAHNVAWPTKGA